MRVRREGDTKTCAGNSRHSMRLPQAVTPSDIQMQLAADRPEYSSRPTAPNAARGQPPQTPAPTAARAGFHQLVARKGGAHVGLGLTGLRGGSRRGQVARPPTAPFPFPLTHTHLSSTT